MGTIPKALIEHINAAFPANVVQVATTLPNGYAQVTLRGSVLVFDDDHMALWERGKGSTNANLKDGDKVTLFYRNPKLRESGMLPAAGVARFYGVAKLHKSGPMRDQIWERIVQPEKEKDPEQKGFAVTINIERAEDLNGKPLNL